MENIILEMKKISKEEDSFIKVRNKLKEYLHYFVLDFIYNSEFKDMMFYGGSCLRIIYNLPRMSIDLDFETEQIDIDKLKRALKEHFSVNLKLGDKFYIKGEKKDNNENRLFLNFPVMNELGLSVHKDESLKIRIDIMSVPKGYLKKLTPVLTLKSKYGKTFVIKHYDLPTLFASKLAAILDRPQKGFAAGKENIDFKGRDFYDLIWYMEQGIFPNENMLKLKHIKGSIQDIFDEITLFISKRKLKSGLKNDLEPLFLGPIESFVNSFRELFQKLKARYSRREIKELKEINFSIDFNTDVYLFKFNYLCKDESIVCFVFKLSDYIVRFSEGKLELLVENRDKIIWQSPMPTEKQKLIESYMALFLSKIEDYLKRYDNQVYFTRWESKFIRMEEDNFNPEKQIIFSSGKDILSKKITLEALSL